MNYYFIENCTTANLTFSRLKWFII